MANGSKPDPGARGGDHPTTRRLRELAAQEAAVTKQRLATRTTSARSFFGALARLAEAKAAWGRGEAESRHAQAEAVAGLVGSGLQLGEVAELLGISRRELRTLGAPTPSPPKRPRPCNEGTAGVATTSLSSSIKLGKNGALRPAEPAVGEESGGPGESTRGLPFQ